MPMTHTSAGWEFRPARADSGIYCDVCGRVFAKPAPLPNQGGKRICRDCRRAAREKKTGMLF